MSNNIGIWADGNYYWPQGKEQKHLQIAKRILRSKPRWQEEFNKQTHFDAVDFLIYKKGAIKIGNRYGIKTIAYHYKIGNEAAKVVMEYINKGWRPEEFV